MNRKIIFILFLAIIVIGIVPKISSVGGVNYCCEKTVDGAWCQNEPEENCLTSDQFRAVPTSCDATSYCSLGCCYDSQNGTCMENTPQRVCNEGEGTWDGSSKECDIPQCTKGCCLVGNQAAFVTQTRCKRLSSLYSLETNFRLDITSEVQCIATATADVMGACVFDQDYATTCKMLSQKDCKELETTGVTNVKFHEGWLCSADELATNCGPSKETACVEGRDEVYFLDTCGNLANIYWAEKINDDEYWTRIFDYNESCNSEVSNAASRTCGNCDYYLGSTCKPYDRTKDPSRPAYGDNICRDLSCDYEGEHYEHGETWCATNSKKVANLPGSEYFRMVCYNGEVTVEPCAAFRAEICVNSSIEGFRTAACRVNRWQDCLAQNDSEDCKNTDRRDCVWSVTPDFDADGNRIQVCLPKNPPGFDFWNTGEEESFSESEDICSLGSTQCVVKFEQGFISSIGKDSWKCVENCHCCIDGEDEDGNTYEGCTGEGTERDRENICQSLGDCGNKTNYVGAKGYKYDESNLVCDGDECYWSE